MAKTLISMLETTKDELHCVWLAYLGGKILSKSFWNIQMTKTLISMSKTMKEKLRLFGLAEMEKPNVFNIS